MMYLSQAAGGVVLALAAVAIGAAAPAPKRAWNCWHSADGTNKGAVVIPLIQEGRVLTLRGAEFIEYAILQDNDVGLVAVISYAEGQHLGADVLVIDKATLDFRKTNVFTDGARADNNPRRGKCVLSK